MAPILNKVKVPNAQDNGPVKIVNTYSNFCCLCLMHADEIITLSLTFRREFSIGQFEKAIQWLKPNKLCLNTLKAEFM